MAVTAGTTWHVGPVATYASASDNNGGGFNPAASGTSYAYGASLPAGGAPILALTDLACASNTTLTSATGGFTAAMIGNLVRIVSGTNALAGWYEITARASANSVTIDRTCATDGNMTDGVGNVGGVLASPGALTAAWANTTLAASGQIAYLKTGTYTLTTTTPGPAGPVSIPAVYRCVIEGYNTAFADCGALATIDAGAQTSIGAMFTYASTTAAYRQIVKAVKLNGKSGAGNDGFNLTDAEQRAYGCVAINCDQATTNYGFSSGSCENCLAQDCGLGFTAACFLSDCRATSCTDNGIVLSTVGCHAAVHCIADANLGSGFVAGGSQMFKNCTAHGNGVDGFDLNSTDDCLAVNCAAVSNTGNGYTTLLDTLLVNCADYGNAARATTGAQAPRDINPVTCTGDPFVDAAGGDFRPDATAAQGVYLRAAGRGPYGQTNAVDIGAVQHADPAVSGGGVPVFGGIVSRRV